jgi:hypothetical protein
MKAFQVIMLAGDVMSGNVSTDDLKNAALKKSHDIQQKVVD